MSDSSRVRDWRWLVTLYPAAVPFDTAPYELSLDGVDRSIRATLNAHNQPTTLSPFGWGDPVIVENRVAKVERRPIKPVPGSDPADVLIALLVRLNLTQHDSWAATSKLAVEPVGVFYILDAMGTKLLKRRIGLNPRQFVHLARLAILPRHSSASLDWDANLSPVVRLLEKSDVDTSLPDVQSELLLFADRIARLTARLIESRRQWKGRVSTKRLDATRDRILLLAERNLNQK